MLNFPPKNRFCHDFRSIRNTISSKFTVHPTPIGAAERVRAADAADGGGDGRSGPEQPSRGAVLLSARDARLHGVRRQAGQHSG